MELGDERGKGDLEIVGGGSNQGSFTAEVRHELGFEG